MSNKLPHKVGSAIVNGSNEVFVILLYSSTDLKYII